ncbi:MAG: hypothetical protein H8D56_01400 [Planctomycetes bacterium]|nr:hypothetical protein [Planctomycetota bacterium]
MSINTFETMRYGNLDTGSGQKTKPIQSQYKPNLTQFKPNLTQNKPNSNPIKANCFKTLELWGKTEYDDNDTIR